MKQFILIFTDKTFSETNGANLEEMKDLYIGEVVRLQDRSLKKCIKVEDKEVFELKHRLAMIQDDISYLIKFIDDERLMERFDKYTEVSDSAWNLINNIDIASDLSRDDSLAWKKFNYKKNNNNMKTLSDLFELVGVAVSKNDKYSHWFIDYSGHVNKISIKHYRGGWKADSNHYEKADFYLTEDGIQGAYWFIKNLI
jgi:hypothetical protein